MQRRSWLVGTILVASAYSSAQSVDPKTYDCMQWRMIGPFRGGRTVGAAGVPSQPGVYYIGVNNGGVWRTTDYGQTWTSLFDSQPTGSIGAVAVSLSNPNVVYAGSGEGLHRPDLSTGDGMYRSNDAGKTWTHLGLRDGQQIASISIDPTDENRLFVAVLGHPYGPNEERGVFRSTDGGEHFEKVLYKDANTGAFQVEIDPGNPQTVFAVLYQAQEGPWENSSWRGPNSGLFKSTDGGSNWKQITGGLPTFKEGLGRIGIGIAHSNPKEMYAVVDADQTHGGIYKSEDGGESWAMVSNERRTWGRGEDFGSITVDTKNPDVVYIPNTSCYKSTDGGKNFFSWKGAPGGDDYHTVWVDPNNPNDILLASDQGATVSVNGGATWSSWYNQPTAQFYHVSTDNQFPYWVYGGQQESGSVGIASRGNDGQITDREWHPVGAEEYGYVAPDPLNPNIVYGGKLSKWDRITGQVQDVSPQPGRGGGNYRFLRTAPVLFAPTDPHTLYYAGNVLFKTTDGGNSWKVISPDLSREHPDVPESIAEAYRTPALKTMSRRGVIYTIAPSPVDGKIIWAGTDDGLIHVTRDGGGKWTDVTPPALTAWSKVSIMDAGHFDAGTAYAAINRIRLDDQRPHIYRTHDFGNTWTEIVSGLPEDAPINSVKEDPKRKGLLFAGSERSVWFSLDDGDHWNPLRLYMPATSIRDLVIHEDDLVVGTHGRSFWILDDITPLRQIGMSAPSEPTLFAPTVAYRVRRNTNTDTPLPPEIPAGKNPPDGAILDYYLPANAAKATLEIVDAAGHTVREYSSDDRPVAPDEKSLAVPYYWVRLPKVLSAAAGSHRWVWDLHYTPPAGVGGNYPISAIYEDTPAEPSGLYAPPGEYTVRLTVDGRVSSQKLILKKDPRVQATEADLRLQFEIASGAADCLDQCQSLIASIEARIKNLQGRENDASSEISDLEKKLGPPRGGAGLRSLLGACAGLMSQADGADARPSQAMVKQLAQLRQAIADAKKGTIQSS